MTDYAMTNPTGGILPKDLTASQWLIEMERNGEGLDKTALAKAMIQIEQRQDQDNPLYLRALAGIGAIIAGALFFYLLYFLGFLDFGSPSLVVNGAIFMGGAALLYRAGLAKGAPGGQQTPSLKQDFLIQSALTLLQIGKITFVFGAAQLLDDSLGWTGAWAITAILFLVGSYSYLIFPSSLERFIAAITVLLSVWVSLLISEKQGTQIALYHLVLLGHFAAIGLFLYRSVWRRHLPGLFDALLISLCFGIGIVAMEADIGALSLALLPIGPAISVSVQILLASMIILLILWVAGGRHAARHPAVMAAMAGVVCLALLSDAGILLALGLLIMGYATHRAHQIALGLAFAVYFVARYYYYFDLTLAQKSLILILSGGLLLAGAAILHRFGWNRVPSTKHTSGQEDGS